MSESIRNRFWMRGWAALVCVVWALDSRAEEPTTPAEPPVSFEADVAPILKAHCFECHGAEVRKAGLDLRRRFTIEAGGDSGPALVPGNVEESLIIARLDAGDMPPKDERHLTAEQVALVKTWVANGAHTLGDEPPLEDEATTELTAEDREFWAFQPPALPVVPQVQAIERVRTPVDAFLLAKLEAVGVGFNPAAPKHVLIRRLYFDLIGLPPTPAEVDAFLADETPNAYERLVDRLLESPHYGERQARHWLDVAGYTDSDGYLEADRLRPEAWRYRDYVIRALNGDKPYDRFLLEQLAGDELSDWRRAKALTPQMIDELVATGFLRTAADPTYGNYKEKLECYKVMADTVQIVSSSLIGLTIQCARCHNHKFDPISQREYYRLHAILQASYDPEEWLVSAARGIPMATDAEMADREQWNKELIHRLSQLNGKINELTKLHRGKYLAKKLPAVTDEALLAKIEEALLVAEDKRNDEQKMLVAEHAAGVVLDEAQLFERFPQYKADIERLRAAVAAEMALEKSVVLLRGLTDLDAEPRETKLLMRGDVNRPGPVVEPGVPAVLAAEHFEFQPTPGYKTTGRRKALAEWLIGPQHPLTARVHVNRIWRQHFGRGIVATLDNFGRTGDRPSHPELLDWLAVSFMREGWSQKWLHRLLVTSTAYRQTSAPNSPAATADPENLLLGCWRPQRHSGEVLRDSVLAVAGKLNGQMFGPPVAVARNDEGVVSVVDDVQGQRRSIYATVRRTQPITLLELFDSPRMEINCTRRTESTVLTQSLILMHSKFAESNAAAVADRVLAHTADVDARLESLWKLLYAREPTDAERDSVRQFLAEVATADQSDSSNAATTKRFAWAQLALVLINANEFVYVH